jgi:uncharacterized protein (TIGR03905 family)
MHHEYRTKGTCSTKIEFNIVNKDIIDNVVFTGGCNGNLKAISKLVDGKKAEDIIKLLKGNTCGYKPTSCADQLALALEEALKKENLEK